MSDPVSRALGRRPPRRSGARARVRPRRPALATRAALTVALALLVWSTGPAGVPGTSSPPGADDILARFMADPTMRAYPRFAIAAVIELRGEHEVSRGRSRNVSRGGLCVEVDRAVAAGATVGVAMTLVFDDNGESEALVLAARVAWCTPLGDRFQVGCQFLPLPARDDAGGSTDPFQ
jgi:hypothetical protein